MSFDMAVPAAPDAACPRAGRAGPMEECGVDSSRATWYMVKAS
jgi:hypothetical protein